MARSSIGRTTASQAVKTGSLPVRASKRLHRLLARTSGFQPEKTGSIPVGDSNFPILYLIMRLPKLGQTFWIRDDRSDYECKVICTKVCTFLDGTKFTDILVQQIRLNDFHVSFYPVEKRTREVSYRYYFHDKKLSMWEEPRNWPGHVPGSWQAFKYELSLTVFKNLRKCEHSDKSYKQYIKSGGA